jgi:hypothetical protein
MAQPTLPSTQPPPATYAQTSAASRMSYTPSSHGVSSAAATQMYAAPAAAAAGAGAGAGAGAFASYHNQHSPNAYPEPSPMTTPSGSPGQQYAHQPHAPHPVPAPAYYHAQNGDGGAMDPPDRRDSSTPVSTYNGTIPVSPASALGPMPGEPQAMGGVPLALQPGMGYRPYRPGSTAVTVSTVSAAGSGSPGNGNGVRTVSGSTPPPQAEGQGLGITGNDGPGAAGGKGAAVELP